MNIARLLLPALRWNRERGWEDYRETIERGLEIGVGGFILFLGEAESVRELCAELHQRAPYPLLIASDLERGAGQQFRGATPLPPAAALGALDDLETTRRAGELTAREARALGINWIYAPVTDVDLEPDNPIIGTRAFGRTPERVADHVGAWVRGCNDGGALSCAKHFPGHGRTVGDSHIERPTVTASREQLERDLHPFRAAFRAGTDSVMTAHVAYTALDEADQPATLSSRILCDLLREEMHFGGLVVTDALIMEGLTEDIDEAGAAVEAIRAGCDAILYPKDMERVARELAAALADGRLDEARAAEAIWGLTLAATRVAGGPRGEIGREEDRRWALDTAFKTLRAVRGAPRLPDGPVRVEVVDDDLGGPWPAYPRDAFPAALRGAGVELSDQGTPLIALYSDIRAWKGSPGISPEGEQRVAQLIAEHPDATVVLFGPPRLSQEIPTVRNLLAAWGGESLMQEAAVAWLTGKTGGPAGHFAGLDR